MPPIKTGLFSNDHVAKPKEVGGFSLLLVSVDHYIFELR